MALFPEGYLKDAPSWSEAPSRSDVLIVLFLALGPVWVLASPPALVFFLLFYEVRTSCPDLRFPSLSQPLCWCKLLSFRTRQSSHPARSVKSQDLNLDLVVPRLVPLLPCTRQLPAHRHMAAACSPPHDSCCSSRNLQGESSDKGRRWKAQVSICPVLTVPLCVSMEGQTMAFFLFLSLVQPLYF